MDFAAAMVDHSYGVSVVGYTYPFPLELGRKPRNLQSLALGK